MTAHRAITARPRGRRQPPASARLAVAGLLCVLAALAVAAMPESAGTHTAQVAIQVARQIDQGRLAQTDARTTAAVPSPSSHYSVSAPS